MVISGQTVGYGVAVRPVGSPVCYRMVRPEKSPQNLAVLGKESTRWKQIALRYEDIVRNGQMAFEVSRRARFADEVLAAAAENLRIGLTDMILSEADDRILGVLTYGFISPTEASLNLLAVDPENLSGTPGQAQLRGIGTGLVAAASREFLKRGAEKVNIHPMDQTAALFWAKRGFQVCGGGGLMCVRGREAVERLIGDCEMRPDRPDQGDVVICGLPRSTEAMRVHR